MTDLTFVEQVLAETGVPYRSSPCLWEAEAAEEALNHEPDHSCCEEGDREMIGTSERTPATVLNAIAVVFMGDDWQPLTTRYRLAAGVVSALRQAGYVIVPSAEQERV